MASAIQAGEERAKKEEEEASRAQLARVEYFSSISSRNTIHYFILSSLIVNKASFIPLKNWLMLLVDYHINVELIELIIFCASFKTIKIEILAPNQVRHRIIR